MRVSDEHAGKRARCPGCGYISAIPSTSADESSATPLADTDYSAPATTEWLMKSDDGQVYGPVGFEELEQWAAQGRISPSSQLRGSSERGWQSACDVFPQLLQSPAAAQVERRDVSAARRPQPAARAMSPFGAVSRAQPHRGGMILALGLVGLCLCPPVGAAVVVLASIDLHRMRCGEMDDSGAVLTTVGLVLGGLALLVGVIVLIPIFAEIF
jgi:hypothetical protein